MTADNAIITRLAREVMGWTVVGFHYDDRKDGVYPRLVQQFVKSMWWVDSGADSNDRHAPWNPLKSLADAFEVQTELLKNPRLASLYAYRLNDMAYNGLAVCPSHRVITFLLSATPRQRCEAAIAALDQV